ncbi:hypothetical protein Tsubulata_003126 [Turnera subulata]|uniref:Uncharacterized protein n=1 Tax=Turnera subulata TaxID=218843 RepID=A0A9Q0FVX2_9ROSI|nr:hypothetical protein Tsubulata_003126 [Turnera subulata]
MTIYRHLQTLIAKTPNSCTQNVKTRTFFTIAATTSTIPSPPLHFSRFSPTHPRSLSPLSKWIPPPFQHLQGPRFFPPSTPWKLLQSSTPFHLRVNNAAVLQKVEAFNLNLHRLRTRVLSVNQALLVREPVKEVEKCNVDDGFVQSFVNWPNFISFSRLVSGPFIGWMITQEMYSSAFAGLAIAGISDWLDGYVARKMTINSVVGSYLDPLADKVLIGCVAVAMVDMGLLHPGLVGVVVMRDVALVGGAVYHRARSLGWKWSNWSEFFNLDGTNAEKVKPLFISKVNTVFQLALVAAALLQPEFGTEETQSYITYLSWLVGCTTVASTAAYGAKYVGNRSSLLAKKKL